MPPGTPSTSCKIGSRLFPPAGTARHSCLGFPQAASGPGGFAHAYGSPATRPIDSMSLEISGNFPSKAGSNDFSLSIGEQPHVTAPAFPLVVGS